MISFMYTVTSNLQDVFDTQGHRNESAVQSPLFLIHHSHGVYKPELPSLNTEHMRLVTYLADDDKKSRTYVSIASPPRLSSGVFERCMK
jgi:hypothetical protein